MSKPENIAANFQSNIEYLTRERGKRQEFAEAAGITNTAMNNIVRGKVAKGSALTTVYRLARHAGFTLDQITLPPPKFKVLVRKKKIKIGKKRKNAA